jgi:hypothetical protein
MSAGGAGGSAGPDQEETFSESFLQVTEVLHANCGSKCHGGGPDQQHLINLNREDLSALYDQITLPIETDLCWGQQLVVPGAPESSIIVRVLQGPLEDPCVLPQMPAGCDQSAECLNAESIAIIESWIADGAPR